MPIEIKVTKEIGNYEPKFIGPFTARQFLVFGIAGVCAVFLYKSARTIAPKSIAGYICLLPAAVALLFNWKPYGMKFEKFVQSIFVNMFLAPMHRRYRTENTMEETITKLAEAELAREAAANEPRKKERFKPPWKKAVGNNSTASEEKKSPSKSKPLSDKKSDTKAKSKSYKMSSKAIR